MGASDTGALAAQRVVVLHNEYREPGGEERYVAQLTGLLERRSDHVTIARRTSSTTGRVRGATGMIAGGIDPSDVSALVRDSAATIVHAHNVHPTFGWRALAAARRAGAAVVLHLHNYRLYCAIGIAYRDGHDCDDCARRRTWNAPRHDCRGSLPESAVYGAGLGAWQGRLLSNVDIFVSPTQRLADDLAAGGFDLPVEVLPTWLPDGEFADVSASGDGEYALFAGRVAVDKGILLLVEASAASGVPLRVAGDGPALAEAVELARRLAAPVEFLGRLDGQALVAARLGAAFCVVPSLWREVLPFSALESMAAGLPLVVSDGGGLVELTDDDLVFERGDTGSLAAVMRRLSDDRALRAERGARALDRARGRFSERGYVAGLERVYSRALASRAS